MAGLSDVRRLNAAGPESGFASRAEGKLIASAPTLTAPRAHPPLAQPWGPLYVWARVRPVGPADLPRSFRIDGTYPRAGAPVVVAAIVVSGRKRCGGSALGPFVSDPLHPAQTKGAAAPLLLMAGGGVGTAEAAGEGPFLLGTYRGTKLAAFHRMPGQRKAHHILY